MKHLCFQSALRRLEILTLQNSLYVGKEPFRTLFYAWGSRFKKSFLNSVPKCQIMFFNSQDIVYQKMMCMTSIHHFVLISIQSVLKALMKTWSELYRTFARLSALVPNAETNIIVEYMSSRILETYTSKDHLHVSRVHCS